MTLRSKLIRLAHSNPEIRAEVLPLLKSGALSDEDSKKFSQWVKDVQSDFSALQKKFGEIGKLGIKSDLDPKVEKAVKDLEKAIGNAGMALIGMK